MFVHNLKPRGSGLVGRMMGMDLVGDVQAGKSKGDGLFTVRVDYDESLGGDFRGRAEVFKYRKGTWTNTTLLREDGEEAPTLFPRYRTVPDWLVRELETVRAAWKPRAKPAA